MVELDLINVDLKVLEKKQTKKTKKEKKKQYIF